ncbi:hypothetical protein SAMN05443575_1988 [Jatrophihabitans endophyticus]|uniref:Uncharacterized protein n=1 Tax=Jatrophihabitans endophyticus TaxID=1206085 RepID=A0A1M5IS71_9ACTN|nr:hypothetical protein [Jatrophihabitans endophyticus]SHG31167.1 hypothetical protein SAMN05443575_1988 [Jatrophihabitans endophyticus]
MRLGGDLDSHYLPGDEYNQPHYRVSLWTGTTEEWVEIYEADVDEVLTWVAAHSDGRAATIWARIALQGGEDQQIIDVRLRGIDPTGYDEDYPPWAERVGSPTARPDGAAAEASATRISE